MLTWGVERRERNRVEPWQFGGHKRGREREEFFFYLPVGTINRRFDCDTIYDMDVYEGQF